MVFCISMDTIGTFEMAKELSKHKMLTAIHKHYSVDQWVEFIQANPEVKDYVSVSSGASEDDFKKLAEVRFSIVGDVSMS